MASRDRLPSVSNWKRNRLRVIRAEKRLTQTALAKRLGMSQSTYCLMEICRVEPDAAMQQRIAKALGVTVSTLLESKSS